MRMSMVTPVCVFLLTCLALATAQSSRAQQNNPCLRDYAQKSCGACIATGAECGWCLEEDFDKDNRARCDKFENLADAGGCDPSSIIFPADGTFPVKDFNVQDGLRPEDAVQIQPQEVRFKIRPNKPMRIPITFRQAKNYPVDLYYLMDLSNSMEDDKLKLAELGNRIADEMSEITKNFRLGFGSFVDKVVMPYVSTVPEKLNMPCRMRNGQPCESPYGFKNQLRLDLDTTLFAQQVRAANVSGNLDAPEGGFDAIMQAVACDESIGWRDVSRRMLLFSTDAGFHYAGDGKLGGIVKPNDGLCHMDSYGVYTESSNQDYPSVSQISAKIIEKNVNIIFAVTKDQTPVYEKLATAIEGSLAGELANDSSNIVDLIRENYDKITSKVILNTQNAENVTVKFFSKCFGDKMKETNECEELGIGANVTFEVEITVAECPRDRSRWNRTVTIYPVGLSEKLILDLRLICECDCEKPGQEIPYSPLCSSGNGTYECGKCTCNPGRYGKNCECDSSKVSSEESDAKCIKPNSTVPCSGRGQCVCGVCECFPRTANSAQKYSGTFCECDNYSCDYSDGELCGGPERGRCQCGTCICNAQYNGSGCDCNTDKSKCFTDNGLECNKHGKCVCGKCECNKTERYIGPTCEECPTCPGKCLEQKECVQCHAFETGPKSLEQCRRDCKNIVVQSEIKESDGVRKCQYRDEDECHFYFTYEYDSDGELHIKVQRTKVCPESVNVLAIVGGVVGGIVAVGLALLLIWKMLTIIHDRREFAKFEKERQNAKWDTGENPIYKQATSTFKNPMYGGRQ
ncbi:integrin beta-PS-like [Haliotis cracherodii]|uniref:integrin beta-PS-like n=1 Tax=Haliotis cracherodii TaxID=6455 RepID=UPI001EB0A064|nr:integrin beta-PS-like isoform X1 [Haliotis rufescens]